MWYALHVLGVAFFCTNPSFLRLLAVSSVPNYTGICRECPVVVDLDSQVPPLGACGYSSDLHFDGHAPSSFPSFQNHCLRFLRRHLQPVVCELPTDFSCHPVRSAVQLLDRLVTTARSSAYAISVTPSDTSSLRTPS